MGQVTFYEYWYFNPIWGWRQINEFYYMYIQLGFDACPSCYEGHKLKKEEKPSAFQYLPIIVLE